MNSLLKWMLIITAVCVPPTTLQGMETGYGNLPFSGNGARLRGPFYARIDYSRATEAWDRAELLKPSVDLSDPAGAVRSMVSALVRDDFDSFQRSTRVNTQFDDKNIKETFDAMKRAFGSATAFRVPFRSKIGRHRIAWGVADGPEKPIPIPLAADETASGWRIELDTSLSQPVLTLFSAFKDSLITGTPPPQSAPPSANQDMEFFYKPTPDEPESAIQLKTHLVRPEWGARIFDSKGALVKPEGAPSGPGADIAAFIGNAMESLAQIPRGAGLDSPQGRAWLSHYDERSQKMIADNIGQPIGISIHLDSHRDMRITAIASGPDAAYVFYKSASRDGEYLTVALDSEGKPFKIINAYNINLTQDSIIQSDRIAHLLWGD